jgi:RNA polymerase sigma-70 factor, ECF subfamily
LIRVENIEELLVLMDELEPMDREILLLKFFLGARTEDIASQFGLTRAAIDNRIYRSKKKLRQQASKLKLGGIPI